jgi:excisionase family DNA binding protein
MQTQRSAESAQTEGRTKPYRVAEVAKHFDVDTSTVYRLISAGQLKALRIGSGRGALRVPVRALAEYEASISVALAEVA